MERDRLLEQPDGYLKIIEQWDHTVPGTDEHDLVDDLWDIED
jgi:hypothetical protein